MRTTILIKENRTELILEYENNHEKAVLEMMKGLPNTYMATFFDCQGGWTRGDTGQKDLIIVFDKPINKPL